MHKLPAGTEVVDDEVLSNSDNQLIIHTQPFARQ